MIAVVSEVEEYGPLIFVKGLCSVWADIGKSVLTDGDIFEALKEASAAMLDCGRIGAHDELEFLVNMYAERAGWLE